MISVIIPVYNTGSYLSRCIESILTQSFDDYEILLIDDVSQDQSGHICDALAANHEKIKVIHQKNAGVSAARNKGIEEAQGEYICFVDSDDYVGSEYLAHLMCSNADLVIAGFVPLKPNGDAANIKKYDDCVMMTEGRDLFCNYFVQGAFNYPFAKRFKTAIIQQNSIRFVDDLKIGEDTVFVLDYIKDAQMIQFNPSAEYRYVKYEGGTLSTQSFNDTLISNLEKCNDCIYDRLNSILKQDARKINIQRITLLYKNLILELIHDKTKHHYQFIKFLYAQKWFSDVMKNSALFPEESKKFRLILRMKSPLCLFLFLRFYKRNHR